MRLIDTDAIEKEYHEELRADYEDDYGRGFQAGLLVAIHQPAIEAGPVAHGRWSDDGTCPVCKKRVYDDIECDAIYARYAPLYCPNCGARMDEVKDDEGV